MAEKRDENGGRDERGRFGAGNPGGGRKAIPPEVREMLAAATPHAATRLIEALDATMVVHYMGVEVGTYVDQRTRLMASQALFDRLYGKPAQAITGEDGGPLQVEGVDLTKLNEAQFAALVALRDSLKEG